MKTIILLNQMREEDNKALGLGYFVEEDRLHVMVTINFSRKKPNPLTQRELLSQVSGLYDPVGLVTPAKQSNPDATSIPRGQ